MGSGYPGSAVLACPDCGAPKSGTAFKRCKPCADIAKRSPGICSVDGCDRGAKTNGMCKNHAEHARRASLPFVACSEPGCEKDRRYGTAGRCGMHSRRFGRHGTTDESGLSRRPDGTSGTRQELRRSYEGTRRARKAAAFVEHVDLATVWERDDGICHICRQPADRSDWQLEHVVPITKGGQHSYANTAVSHPICNRKKGARLGV